MKVQLLPRWKNDSPQCAKVVQVVEKAPKEFNAVVTVDEKVFRFLSKNKKIKGQAYVVDPQKKSIPIIQTELNSAMNGDVVMAIVNPPRFQL